MKMNKNGMLMGLFLLGATVLQAASTSTFVFGGGLWSDPATWENEEMPQPGQNVWIKSGHTVVVDTATAEAGPLTIEGTLRFSRASSATLTMVGGDVNVMGGGVLDMGAEGDAIPDGVKAELILARGSSPAQYGLIVQNNGTLRVRGMDKTPYAFATASAIGGSFSVQVPLAQAQGWKVDDVITLGKTGRSGVDETEVRQITDITGTDPLTLWWTGGLLYSHAGSLFIVGNMTRNAVIRSSGTVAGGDSAYVRLLTQNVANAQLVQGEFADLGADQPGRYGLTLDGVNVRAFISSSSVHGGSVGIRSSDAGGNVFQYNHVCKNAGGGFYLRDNVENQLLHNSVCANSEGVRLVDQDRTRIENNHIYGNTSIGITLVSSHFNTLVSNKIFGSANFGMWMFNADFNTLAFNRFHRNVDNGMAIETNNDRNLLVGNDTDENGGHGLYLGGDGNVSLSHASYANAGNGYVPAEGRNDFVDGWVGYNRSLGIPSTNHTGGWPEKYQIQLADRETVRKPVMKNTRVLADGVGTYGFGSGAGNSDSYLLSYNQDGDLGSVRLWGNYAVSGAFAMEHAAELYASTATAPKRIRGAGGSGTVEVLSVDGTALSQRITVTRTGGQWVVEGSVSGPLGPLAGPVAGVTLQTIGTPVDGDQWDFVTIAASGDAGVPKKLYFGPVYPDSNGGKSRLTLPPGATMTLRGESNGVRTRVERLPGSLLPYTIISSGTFLAEDTDFRNLDADGLQFGDAGSVSLLRTSFDGAPANGAYITTRNLASSRTFFTMAFGNTSGAASVTNVRVTGVDGALTWAFDGWSGVRGGAEFESDPNRRVRWLDAVAPGPITGLSAAPGSAIGDIRLDWASGGNNGGAGYFSGEWRVFASTVATEAQGAVPAQAQVVIATSAAVGSAHGRVYSGLLLDTSYYFRLWALDDAGNTSLSAATTAQALHPDPLPPSATAVAFQDQISVAWAAPSMPPAAYLDHYELTVSTGSAAGPYSPLDLNIPRTTLSFAHGNLPVETSFHYRLVTVDAGGRASIAATPSATTPDILPPLAAAITAAPGAAPGEILVTWNAAGDNNGGKALPAGSRFALQYTTDPGGVVWDHANAQIVLTTGPVAIGAPQSISIPNLTGGQSYSFRLWSADNYLNWSPASNIHASLPRENRPSGSFGSLAAAAAVPASQTVAVSFDKDMQTGAVAGAFSLRRLRNTLGEAVDEAVPAQVTWDPAGRVFTLTPDAPLAGNSLYEARVAATAADAQGNALASPLTARFMTLLNRSEENVWVDEALNVRVRVPAGSLAEDGYLAADGALPAAAALATRKIMANTGDSLRSPVAGSEASLRAFSTAGLSQDDAFLRPLTVSLPYPDADGNGMVDGTNPPARVRTLQVHWLDEAHNLWVPLASDVDAENRRVSAPAPHFTSFALLARSETAVDEAYAFPSPFTPTPARSAITFMSLPQTGSVRIYTPSGALVRELTMDGAGQQDWDAKNADGEPVASGVYLYEVTNGRESKIGKIGVIR